MPFKVFLLLVYIVDIIKLKDTCGSGIKDYLKNLLSLVTQAQFSAMPSYCTCSPVKIYGLINIIKHNIHNTQIKTIACVYRLINRGLFHPSNAIATTFIVSTGFLTVKANF